MGAIGGLIVHRTSWASVSAACSAARPAGSTPTAPTTPLLKKDANGRNDFELNPQVLWQINDKLSDKVSVYWSHGKSDGGPGTLTKIYTAAGQPALASQTFTTPQVCNTTTRPSAIPFATVGQPTTAIAWNPTNSFKDPVTGVVTPGQVLNCSGPWWPPTST